MIGKILRLLLVTQLLALELIVTARLGGYSPDLSAVLVLLAALILSPGASLWLLLLLALPRSLMLPGALHTQIWLLLGVWLVMRHLSRYVFFERWYWQMLLAALACFGLSLGQGFLLGSGEDPLQRGVVAAFVTAVVAPGLFLIFAPLLRGLQRDGAPRREIAT